MTSPRSTVTRTSRGPLRNACFCLAGLAVAFVFAFKQSFFKGATFSGLSLTLLIQIHTVLMVLWYVLLIAQAWFVRTRRFRLHRLVGRSSFVIVPLTALMTMVATHEMLNRTPDGITPEVARLEVTTWGQVVPFVVTWALGILYRKKTRLHVRFMISTAFAISTALVFRIILSWFAWVPGLDTFDGAAVANCSVLSLMLLALIATDWRAGIKWSPYWVVTGFIAVMHIGLWTFGRSDQWSAFVEWFARL